MDPWFATLPVASGVTMIAEPGHVISYLIAGRERAVLLDTGLGVGDMAGLVAGLTTLPVLALNSHADFDHVGANTAFAELAAPARSAERLAQGVPAEELAEYVAAADAMIAAFRDFAALDDRWFHTLRDDQVIRPWPAGFDRANYRIPPSTPTQLLRDGDRIELGGRTLEVLEAPGHCADLICLLDRQHRLLFSTDAVYEGPLYAQSEDADLRAYRETTRRLAALRGAVDLLLPAHGPAPLPATVLERVDRALVALLDGRASIGEARDAYDRPVREAQFGRFSILLPSG